MLDFNMSDQICLWEKKIDSMNQMNQTQIKISNLNQAGEDIQTNLQSYLRASRILEWKLLLKSS